VTTPPDLLPPATRRPRAGAHRARGSLLAAVMPSVLAVAAVAALITSLAVWQSEDQSSTTRLADRSDRGAASAQPTPSSAQALSTDPSPTPTPTASASPSASPSATASATRQVEVAGTKAARPSMEVVVLNQTSRRGLAATVADRLRTSGWDVPHVGNFRGIVPSTTVYYPSGAESEAMAVANDLPTAPRVRPRFGNLSTSRLTVVVTDSYPG
jgi:hypothetical protein